MDFHQKQMPPYVKNLQDVEEKIKEKQKRYETSTMSAQEEKKIIQEIDQLKKARPSASKITEIKAKIDKYNQERKDIKVHLDKARKDVDKVEADIEAAKAKQKTAREQQNEVYDSANVHRTQANELREELNKLYQQKDDTRESHYESLYKYTIQKQKVEFLRSQHDQRQMLLDAFNAQKDKIEAKKQALADRPNPKEREIDTCDQLITFIEKKMVALKLVSESSEVLAKETQEQMLAQQAQSAIDEKISQGKMLMVAAKDERDADIAVQFGKKNKKGKKQKAAQEKKEDEFDIDFQRINMFSFVQVSPPLAPSELEQKIDEIKKKRAAYQEQGEKMLKDEEAELNKAIEVEQEEIKNQGEIVIEDEFRRGGRGRGRGARGGFGGRGGRKFRN